MKLIGLCGRSGSGKGVFAQCAMNSGIKVLDCDKIYQELVSRPTPCLYEIAEHFGEDSILNGSLNRRYLAPIVFSSKSKLELLNKITHKYITAEIDNILSSANHEDIYILDAPTLFESGLNVKCLHIVAVISDDENCIKRIIARDNISIEEAFSRLNSQYSADFLARNCDIIIYNNSTLEEYKMKCIDVINKLKGNSL